MNPQILIVFVHETATNAENCVLKIVQEILTEGIYILKLCKICSFVGPMSLLCTDGVKFGTRRRSHYCGNLARMCRLLTYGRLLHAICHQVGAACHPCMAKNLKSTLYC